MELQSAHYYIGAPPPKVYTPLPNELFITTMPTVILHTVIRYMASQDVEVLSGYHPSFAHLPYVKEIQNESNTCPVVLKPYLDYEQNNPTKFVLHFAKNVHHLEFPSIYSLEHLTHFVALETLSLSKEIPPFPLCDLNTMQALAGIDLRERDASLNRGLAHLNVLTRLCSLSLANCDWLSDGGLNKLTALSNLRVLDLKNCPHITQEGLRSVSTTFNRLIYLNLSNCTELHNHDMLSLGQLTELEVLDLTGYQGLTAERIQVLSLLPLQDLNLTNCANVRDILDVLSEFITLKRLNLSQTNTASVDLNKIKKLTNLEELNISNCPGISRLDVLLLPWASLRILTVTRCPIPPTFLLPFRRYMQVIA